MSNVSLKQGHVLKTSAAHLRPNFPGFRGAGFLYMGSESVKKEEAFILVTVTNSTKLPCFRSANISPRFII